ncbi:MAG: hypothetical protein IPM39_20445 [Chloroflexi bacterium]|nr:hypothetical protein [Chloroflexota bacterium]
MKLLDVLRAEAVRRGLLAETAVIDAATAFHLVRDMPYIRASSRQPEAIIQEWRGTCSGKHYVLKALLAELGIASRLMACTAVTEIDLADAPPALRPSLEMGHGRFVDVHNYLILDLPTGEMVVDATWPLAVKGTGLVVNEQFVPDQNQEIACTPLQSWVVPADQDPQTYKDYLLTTHFSAEELAARDAFVLAMGSLFQMNE